MNNILDMYVNLSLLLTESKGNICQLSCAIMKIVIAGATGLIGSVLVQRLWKQHHSLVLLSRKPPRESALEDSAWLVWQPGQVGEWERAVDGADGMINLAGEPIAEKRWSKEQKERLRDSRIDATRSLVNAIAKAKVKPKFLVSSSAVGFYGNGGDEKMAEQSKPGDDFLARLCVDWEQQAKKAEFEKLMAEVPQT